MKSDRDLKRGITLRRWVEILSYAFIGACVVKWSSALLPVYTISDILSQINFWHLFFLSTGVCIVFRRILAPSAPFKHVSFRYPPLWFSIIIGIFLCYIDPFDQWNDYGGILLGSGAFVLANILYETFCFTKKQHTTSKNRAPTEQAKFDLFKWIDSEIPIHSEEEDLFGHQVMAKIIANTIHAKKRPTIGLIGDFGVGKSSILKLVEKQLHERGNTDSHKRKIVVSTIDAWGFGSQNLLKDILSEGVRALRPYVDVVGISQIPQHYIRALESENHGAFLTALLTTTSEEALLQQLDNVLEATQLHLVYFLEDVDRNASDDKAISTLSALLDRFSSMTNNVSFVVTCAVENAKYETINRICHYLFSVTPNEQTFRELINTYRRERNDDDAVGQHIDPFDSEFTHLRNKWFSGSEKESMVEFNAAILEYVKKSKDSRYSIPLFAMAKLIKSPRVLKCVLRDTHRIWCKLYGEVDPDEVLILMCLKYAKPDVYKKVMSDHKNMINTIKEKSKKEKGPKTDANKCHNTEEKSGIIFEATDDKTADVAVDTLLEALFLKAENDQERPQSIATYHSDGVGIPNYWRRIEMETINSDVQDQEVLKLLKNACEDPKDSAEDLIEYASKDNNIHHVDQFIQSMVVQPPAILTIVNDFLKEDELSDKGLSNVIRSFRHCTAQNMFESVTNVALDHSLHRANQVFLGFYDTLDSADISKTNEEHRLQYIKALLSKFELSCNEPEQALLNLLEKDSSNNTSISTFFSIVLRHPYDFPTEIRQWNNKKIWGDESKHQRIINELLKALKSKPNIMVPQLINLFRMRIERIDLCTADSLRAAQQLFRADDDYQQFELAVKKYPVSDVLDEHTQRAIGEMQTLINNNKSNASLQPDKS